MVRGPLRTVLWALGALGFVWVILWVLALPTMGGTMGENGIMGGRMGGGGIMAGGMMAMTGAMLVQSLGMLGLAGVFVYLVVDTMPGRRDGKDRPAPTEEPER